MFGLSRLLKLAGSIGWRLNNNNLKSWVGQEPRTLRRTSLQLETLEERMVPTLLGQNLFPADYPWNQNIANAPVAANSAAVISHIGTTVTVHPDWGNDDPANGTAPLYGIPINVVHGNTAPKVSVVIDAYASESDIIPVPMPSNPVIEGDYQNGPNLNGPGGGNGQRGDSHLIIWDEDNNIVYELYEASRPNDAVTAQGTSTGGVWHAAQESVFAMNGETFRPLGNTSADAAGLSILAGLARPDEGLPTSMGGQGAMNHALRFTLPYGMINPQYVYPASHVVSATTGSANVPFGARFRLKNTADVNTKIASLAPEAQILARTMQQYGLVLADIGAPMYVTGASSSRDANNNKTFVWNMDDVLGLRAITAGDFELVDLTPRVTGLSSTNAAPGNTISVFGQNFSGSAGHLSVFFGSTPAPSVTYVSDTQLTVVVPAGAGAVDVTVQSGVNAVDPNGQSHNSTAPIFGYGNSATSAADLFTFGATQTVSGANSTASFATPSVTSGLGDVLTIAVKDTTGSPFGGLASSAFSFSLSGGSTGTFAPVSATATTGTYTTTFTGALAGSVSTLTIRVGGVTLAVQPTITVNVGAVNGTGSTVNFAAPTVTVGGTDALTIVLKDSAGNAVSGLSGAAFGLSLSGGTSVGSFSSVSETATPGTYTTTFTGATAGTATALTVTVNGTPLTTHPSVAVVSSTSFSDDFSTAGGNQQLNSSWTQQAGGFNVNTAAHTATGVNSINLATVNGISSADEAVSAVMSLTSGQTAGLVARYVGAGDRNMYLGNVKATSGGYTASILRNVDGTWTQLYAKSFAGSVTNATVEFDVIGSSLRLFVNGSIAAFASDTNLVGPGAAGMRSTAGAVYNSFAASPLVLQNSASPSNFSDTFATAGNNQQLSNTWFNQAGNFHVDTTTQSAIGGGTINLATVNGISSADELVSATVTVTGSQTAGLVARHVGPGDRNMYLAVIGPTSNGYYTANLSRNVNGTWKQLYSHKYAGSVTNALMEFHVVGTSLRLYLNGVVVAFANDTLLTAAGSVGMRAKAGAIMRGFNAAATTLADPGFGFVDHFSTPGANGQLNEDWFNQAGNIGVNHGVATGAAAANVATVNGFTSADVTVQADFALTAVGQMAGLITRYSGSGDQNMYFARLAQTGTHTYQVALYVNVAGTWKVLKAQSVSTVTGTMRLTMSGSSMTISYNGAALFTVVDSSISAAGSVGLRMNAGATAANFSISQ